MVDDLCQRLEEKNLRVFLDEKEPEEGKHKISQIQGAIRTASVHIPVLSPGYAESSLRLNELLLMLETGATIIPVFCGVRPLDLQRIDDHGDFAESLAWKEKQENVKSEDTGKWKKALSDVSSKDGFELKSYNSDVRQLVNAIVEAVETEIGHVFINCSPDLEKKFANHLCRGLTDRGVRVFLNREELRKGNSSSLPIKDAIEKAKLHIVILCNEYLESTSCVNELVSMKKLGVMIIPVFYGVEPSKLRRLQNQGKHPTKTLDIVMFLSEFADIIGFNQRDCNDDAELVSKIVERVESIGKASTSYKSFICHRGPDTKTNLVSHLHSDLDKCGMQPFLDRESLVKGLGLETQIEKAIATVSVNIVIFSENFASSPWCLKELVRILVSKAHIIPVLFHRVEISDLETSEDSDGEYARALRKLKDESILDPATNQVTPKYDSSTIEKWKQALSEFGRRKDFININDDEFNGDEVLLRDKIVNKATQLVRKKSDDQISKAPWFRGSTS